MINLHESVGPGRDRTRDPWICSQLRICNQTRYWLRYAARYTFIEHLRVQVWNYKTCEIGTLHVRIILIFSWKKGTYLVWTVINRWKTVNSWISLVLAHCIYWEFTGYYFQKNNAFLFLKIYFVVANSADPDEMPHHAAFHLGLHCFP